VRRTHELLVNHINAVRSLPLLGSTTAVMILESNLAFESQHLLHALGEAGVKKWIALSEGQGGSIGLLTTHARKEEYTLLLREALRIGKISFHEQFTSVSLGSQAAKVRLKDELLNFSIVTQPPTTMFGKVRKTFTGKLGGKQDDLVLALQMSIYGSKMFWQEKKYATYRVNTH